MANKIDLYDGKYTVIDDLPEGGGFRALRYGEEWRDLAGDQLVYSMFCEIERLRDREQEYQRTLESVQEELWYALHSNKDDDTRWFYVTNAKRLIEEVLHDEEAENSGLA